MATATIQKTRDYRDLDLDFTRHPNTSDVAMKVDAEAVKRSIRYLVFTQPGERYFKVNIGCRVYRLLFEPIGDITGFELRRAIEEVISNYEPRARLQEVKVTPQPDENAYNVSITFTVVNLNIPETVTIYLERTR